MTPVQLAAISLGCSLLGGLIAAAYGVGALRASISAMLASQATRLVEMEHAAEQHSVEDNRRFNDVSNRLTSLSNDIQRVLGQMEGLVYREGTRRRRTAD